MRIPSNLRRRPVTVNFGAHGRESTERPELDSMHMPDPGWRLRAGYSLQ